MHVHTVELHAVQAVHVSIVDGNAAGIPSMFAFTLPICVYTVYMAVTTCCT